MFLATLETLAKQEIQLVVCDLPDQMGGFGEQKNKETVCIQYVIQVQNFQMHPRTSRRNSCCSDQQSFYQLLKALGETGLE